MRVHKYFYRTRKTVPRIHIIKQTITKNSRLELIVSHYWLLWWAMRYWVLWPFWFLSSC